MVTFTDADLESVRKAVQTAEGTTSGEIVPFVALRSDAYEASLWRSTILVSLLAIALALAGEQFSTGWSTGWLGSTSFLAALALIGAGAGWLLAYSVPAYRRVLAGSSAMDVAVHRRAKQAFLDEEVFDTRDRTGILLFVSLFEKRIEVLGDSGINAQVSEDEWVDVIQIVRTAIAEGQVAQGLVDGIKRCGELLREHGVAIKPDDTNELPDGLRLDTD